MIGWSTGHARRGGPTRDDGLAGGAPGKEKRVRRAERREARAREREVLRRLPRRERLQVWWRTRPLGMTFTVYLAAYLVVATALALAGADIFATWNNGYYYELEVDAGNGLVRRGMVDGGPYIYDAESDRLLPAAELDLPDAGALAVFIATGARGEAAVGGFEDDWSEETVGTIYATTDLLREGKIQLYDWGLNCNDWYPQEEVLEDNRGISAENLARYDRLSRERRVQSVSLFGQMTGADLEATFGKSLVSNTAYYATATRPAGIMTWLLTFATGLCPVLAYGGLGWLTFRHFYRVHIAGPLSELARAAERIAGQDLDFSIERVRGKELGRLSETLEGMRASLLEAQRELWRTAEERRRLNAAFAHDLRTPITVLKGTVEMAQLRLQRGDGLEGDALDALSGQVVRLERYATAMGGLSKLEDRPVAREPMALRLLADELEAHAGEVVAARGGGVELSVEVDWVQTAPAAKTPLGEGAVAGTGGAPEPDGVIAYIDLPLVEEVLDNLLGNACVHADGVVELAVSLRGDKLVLRVADDGPGFTPEALRRGCDPFFSENKSAEHFGLGLNVSSVLCGLHDGALELSNRDAGGACVTATFGIGDAIG